MYVFERAAEFKARAERVFVVSAKASVRTVVTVTTSTIDFFKSLAEIGHEKPTKHRNRRMKKVVEQPAEEEKPEMSVDDVREQMRILKEQMEAFAKLQAAVAAANAAAAQKAAEAAAAAPPAPTPAPTANIPPAPSINFAPPPPAPNISLAPPPPAPTISFAPPPPPPSLDDLFPAKRTATDKPAAAAPKTAAAPPPRPAGLMITAEDLRRPLRRVNRDNDANVQSTPTAGSSPVPPTPSGGSAQKTEGVVEEIAAKPRSRLSLARIGAVEKAVVVAGKRVQTRSLPGEENMSFTELIKVASKLSLKKTADRSPGGTPMVRSRQPENAFSQALLQKFRNVRESLGGDKENEW